MQTREFFNQAWLDCARLRPDGSVGEERRTSGRTGASIDEAIGGCSFVSEIAERRDYPRTELTESVTRPRPGGRPSEARCPPGAVVTGLRSMSGEYMDHLWIVCSELQRND